MANKSYVASATPKALKTISATKSKAIQLTLEKIRAHAIKRALKEWDNFCENGTKTEWKVVSHLKVMN